MVQSEPSRFHRWFPILALALVAGAGFVSPSVAQGRFPRIPIWAMAGAFQDSSLYQPIVCVGAFKGLPAETLVARPRTVTVRFLRDRAAEVRPDFGGYRIYRVVETPDTSRMQLIRRFSRNFGDARTWNFSVVDTTTLQFMCQGGVANDSIVTFVDPDSNGNYVKQCRTLDALGRCTSRGDSVIRLIAPPGPHDGFRTWYAITYEELNSSDNNYADLFVPGPYDTSGNYSRCGTPGDSTTCPRINLNSKNSNMIAEPVEPTGGPTQNLERVAVVPNPYLAHEAWDLAGQHELHFINLPAHSTIRIYTVAGDLVTKITHDDPVRDFERWDLKNANGHDVASGIYMYRVEAVRFTFQSRFVVVR
jgi:hypothetical protein